MKQCEYIRQTIIFVIVLTFIVVFANVKSCYAMPLVGKLLVETRQQNESVTLQDNITFYTDQEIEFVPDTSDLSEVISRLEDEIKNEYCNAKGVPSDSLEFTSRNVLFNGYTENNHEGMRELEQGGFTITTEEMKQSEEDVVLQFVRTASVSVSYIDENGDERVAGQREIRYESDVYRIKYDIDAPDISIEDQTDGDGMYTQGQTITLNIEQNNSGIKEVIVKSYEEVLADIDLEKEGRVVKFSNQIELPVGSIVGGIGEITITAVSRLGYKASRTINFKSDLKPPVVYTMGVDDGHIYDGTACVKINANDNMKGFNVFYQCRFIDENGNESIIESGETYYPGNNTEIMKNYDVQGVYEITVYAMDLMGNVSDIIIKSFGIDKVAPAISFDGVENGGISGDKTELTVNVKELFFEGMNVEIRAVKVVGDSYTETPLGSFSKGAVSNKNVYSFSGDGEYKIAVMATDSCGHVSNANIEFSIDTSAPQINVMFQGEKEFNSDIINNIPNIDITVDDMCLTDAKVTVDLIRKKSGNVLERIPVNIPEIIGNSVSFPIEIKKEGIYELSVEATDRRGNSSSIKRGFTIDCTPPAIGYLSDYNEKYLKDFNLPGNMQDYIIDMTNVKYKTYLNSKETGSGVIKKDGKYILQVVAWDDAGNTSEEMIAFIVDNTKPSVIISGLNEQGEMCADSKVSLSLYNSDDYFTEVYVNGEKKQLSSDRKKCEFTADGSENYRIYVSARDNANNVLIQTIETKLEPTVAAPLIKDIDLSGIKQLTVENEKNSKNILEKLTPLGMWIICGVICATAVILVTFAFVDSAKNPC